MLDFSWTEVDGGHCLQFPSWTEDFEVNQLEGIVHCPCFHPRKLFMFKEERLQTEPVITL